MLMFLILLILKAQSFSNRNPADIRAYELSIDIYLISIQTEGVCLFRVLDIRQIINIIPHIMLVFYVIFEVILPFIKNFSVKSTDETMRFVILLPFNDFLLKGAKCIDDDSCNHTCDNEAQNEFKQVIIDETHKKVIVFMRGFFEIASNSSLVFEGIIKVDFDAIPKRNAVLIRVLTRHG